MIPVKTIEFHRVEGPTAECQPRTFNSWQAAHAHVALAAFSAPADGSYDKCDVRVTWEDGAAWYFRFDMTYAHRKADRAVARELLNDVRFYSGVHQPLHLSAQEYRDMLDSLDVGPTMRKLAQTIATGHDFGGVT